MVGARVLCALLFFFPLLLMMDFFYFVFGHSMGLIDRTKKSTRVRRAATTERRPTPVEAEEARSAACKSARSDRSAP